MVGNRVVPPARHRFSVDRTQLPVFHRVFDPRLKAAPLLVLAYIEKVLAQDDAVVDDHLPLDHGDHRYEPLVILIGDEVHYPLDPGPVVPRAVEEDDLARRREMRDVALNENLGLLAVGWDRQCHVAIDAPAGACSDAAGTAALARGVSALEDHNDARPLVLDPSLQPG